MGGHGELREGSDRVPSIKHVFPPLLPPPEALPLLAPAPTRRTPRLLVAGVVTTVLGVFAGLVVLVVLIAQPDPRRSDRPRPAVRQAEPGASGLVVDTPDLTRVLEETPTDGRLHGLTRHVDVMSYGYTDRVRLTQAGRPHGETVAAADGEHWLVVELDSEDQPALTSGALAGISPSSLSLVVDGDSTPVPLDGSGLAAFSVPLDAEAVHLVVTDHGLMQKWSFVTERRSEATPDIIYRAPESRVAVVNGSWSLPYGTTSPAATPPPAPGPGVSVPPVGRSTPFGERTLTLGVAQARLAYALGVVAESADGGQDGDGLAFHTASGADRALLYLSGVSVDWGGSDPTASTGYSVRPEDMVLTLPDGTPVEARQVVDDPASAVYDLEEGEPVELGISDGTLVWDVPADLQRATLTIRPSSGAAPLTGDRIDFQGGSIQFEIVFTGA
jgi:hypothetical protein